MSHILIGVLSSVTYLSGMLTCFHVWCRRGGQYLDHLTFKNSYGGTLKLNGWYVKGWQLDFVHPYYSLNSAVWTSFFLWIPVSLITGIRESALLISRMLNKMSTVVLPRHMRADKPVIRTVAMNDPHMTLALQEVNTIAPES